MPIKKTRKGGKYLGQGAFGCTFRPAVRCKTNKNREKNAISKLMGKKNADDEYRLVPLLKKIDPDQRYTLYPYKMCEPELNAVNLNKTYYKGECDALFRKPDKKAIFIKDGGEDLFSLFTRLKPGTFNKLHRSVFRALQNLFLGLEKLHDNDFVHLDIKNRNIVCKIISGAETRWFGLRLGKPTYLMKFIDFGISNNLDDALVNHKTPVDYIYWPFDMRFILEDYMNGTTSISAEEYEKYLAEIQLNRYTNTQHFPYYLLKKTSESPKADDYILIQDYLKAQSPAGKKEARRDILRKTDVYGVGLLLAECYIKCTHIFRSGQNSYSTVFDMELHQMVTVPLYNLVDKMTHYDFRKRLTAKDAQIEYTQLLQNIEDYFKQK